MKKENGGIIPLTIKQKLEIMDRIQKWEVRIAEKEERMLREIKLIQERNNNED